MSSNFAILVMGVAGSGKSTIGSLLARQLGWPFADADDFHSPANVAKMSAGIPLTDEDRGPWLQAIHQYISEHLDRGESVVVTCSALKERYRAVVAPDPARVKLVFLQGDFQLILGRLHQRQGHFMKESMLRSQFEALEPPSDALSVDVGQTPEAIVAQIRGGLHL